MSTRRLVQFNNKIFLVIGPSGVGKSTLINAIYNQSVNATCLRAPAEVSDSMDGCTSACEQYSSNGVTLIDTIGLTDPRFTMEQVFTAILQMIRRVKGGIHGVIVCIKHGRTAKESRKALKAIFELFDPEEIKLKSFITITYDDANTGEYWFLDQTRTDDDAAFLFNATNEQYITGSFIVDSDPDIDKLQLVKKREPFLNYLLLILSSYKVPINLNFELTYEGLINVVYKISSILRPDIPRTRVVQFLKNGFLQLQWVKDMLQLQ